MPLVWTQNCYRNAMLNNLKKLNTPFQWAFTILLLCTMASCKSRKTTTETVTEIVGFEASTQLIEAAQHNWEHFNCKLNLEVLQNKSTMSAKGTLRMTRDSCIWLSVTYFGMEAARVFITKDSFYMMEKFGKRVSIMPIDMIQTYSGANVGLHTLQQMLLGKLIFDVEDKKVNTSQEQDWLLFTYKNDSILMEQRFEFASLMPKELRVESIDSRAKIQVDYMDGVQQIGTHLLPKNLVLNASAEGQKEKMQLTIGIVTPEFPTDLNTQFAIPPSYEQIRY